MKTKRIEDISLDKYELIIFDCDGTLVDSEPLSNRLIAQMITELGVNLSGEAAYEMFVGTSMANIVQFLEKEKGQSLEFDFEQAFRQRCIPLFEKELKVIPGADTFINELDKTICVSSNGPREKMKLSLRITGLLSHFQKENMFSAYDIQKWKPDPALYLHTAKRMETLPKKCLVIEDTISGVMGAVNAGIDVVAHGASIDKAAMEKINVPVFDHYDQLTQLI